ncbi:MAG: DMT family transporter [Gammaproteobacteria bacterium]|nr:DMT family transporter [Gammaproteobacteria bacterium]
MRLKGEHHGWCESRDLKSVGYSTAEGNVVCPLLFALALLIPAGLIEGFSTQWTLPFIATMGWLILVVSLGAYWAMWRLLVRHDATRVASLFYLSPPVTMLMAWAAFGDRLVVTDVVGLIVAGIGVVLVYRFGVSRPVVRVEPPR